LFGFDGVSKLIFKFYFEVIQMTNQNRSENAISVPRTGQREQNLKNITALKVVVEAIVP